MAEDVFYQLMAPIIAAIVGATISGVILLLIHHKKVEQELKLHQEIDHFDRKQKVYREILNHVTKLKDFSLYLGPDTNWKISRHIYNELLLIGSTSVIMAYNEFHKKYRGKTESDDELVRSIWKAVREDLYRDTLSSKDMLFVMPGPKTQDTLKIYDKHSDKLASLELESMEDLAQMDVEEVNSKTGINTEDLEKIKQVAIIEISNEDKLKKFLDSKG